MDIVWERLDKSFANNPWIRNHDSAQLVNLPVLHFDYGAMLLTTHEEKYFSRRPYKFEAMSTTHPECEEIINSIWNNEVPSSLFCLVQKLKVAKNAFKTWNK